MAGKRRAEADKPKAAPAPTRATKPTVPAPPKKPSETVSRAAMMAIIGKWHNVVGKGRPLSGQDWDAMCREFRAL